MREPLLDTGSAARPLLAIRALLAEIFGWVAERERVTILARTKAGRVTPAMFGRLQRSLSGARKILDVAEPETYVALNPVPNAAFTCGHTRLFIT